MPKYSHQIEIANLICKFGDLNLLDMFEETVRPAFFDQTLKREYSNTAYTFYDTKLIELGANSLQFGIIGRLVKDTVLEREQVFEHGKLVDASGSMASAPSSIFLLVLNSHRLLYLKEHRGSPGLDVFRSTLSKFLKITHGAFIQAMRKETDPETGHKFRGTKLVARYPYPTVELVPVASDSSMEAFVHRFKTLETVTVRLLDTNSEIDNDGLFEGLREAKTRINSQVTIVKHENKIDGLSKPEVVSQLTSVAKQGNNEVKIVGIDEAGEKLDGTNEDFKIKIPIDSVPRTLTGAARVLFEKFRNLIDNNVITVPIIPDHLNQKVNDFAQHHRDGNG